MGIERLIQAIQKNQQALGDEEPALTKYETPLVTVDIVLFTIQDNRLKALLIQRRTPPYEHMWAVPGGFIHKGESLEKAATRRLFEETHLDSIYLEQLYAYGAPDRDPRVRVITVSYYAVVSADRLQPEAHANAEDVGWFCVTDLPKLAFDHRRIIDAALERLKEQLDTSPIVFQLLSDTFTLTELQRVYELIMDKKLDKRNFRKKILTSDLLYETGQSRMNGYHRPAQLYAFKPMEDSHHHVPHN